MLRKIIRAAKGFFPISVRSVDDFISLAKMYGIGDVHVTVEEAESTLGQELTMRIEMSTSLDRTLYADIAYVRPMIDTPLRALRLRNFYVYVQDKVVYLQASLPRMRVVVHTHDGQKLETVPFAHYLENVGNEVSA